MSQQNRPPGLNHRILDCRRQAAARGRDWWWQLFLALGSASPPRAGFRRTSGKASRFGGPAARLLPSATSLSIARSLSRKASQSLSSPPLSRIPRRGRPGQCPQLAVRGSFGPATFNQKNHTYSIEISTLCSTGLGLICGLVLIMCSFSVFFPRFSASNGIGYRTREKLFMM